MLQATISVLSNCLWLGRSHGTCQEALQSFKCRVCRARVATSDDAELSQLSGLSLWAFARVSTVTSWTKL